MNKPLIFIQARTSSTRMIGKTIAPFHNGNSILQLLIQRIHQAFPHTRVCVLTTDSEADDKLVQSLAGYPIDIFRGDEKDVLDRFLKAAEKFSVEEVVRICADNPFLSLSYLNVLMEHKGDIDYVSFAFKGKPVMQCHFGFFAERVKVSALGKVSELTNDMFYHEHVTNFIYQHPDHFSVELIDVTNELEHLADIRLTVDTPDDFRVAATVFAKLPDTENFDKQDIYSIIERNPRLKFEMQVQRQNNSK